MNWRQPLLRPENIIAIRDGAASRMCDRTRAAIRQAARNARARILEEGISPERAAREAVSEVIREVRG